MYPPSRQIISGGFKFLDVFSFSFKIDPKITQEASKFALLADRVQLDFCKRAKRYDKDDQRREFHLELRDQVVDALSLLEAALIAKKEDPKGMKKYVDEFFENLQKVLTYYKKVKEIDQMSKEFPVKDPMLTMLGGA